MATIKEILIRNGFQEEIGNISETILNRNADNCTIAKKVGNSIFDLFEGIDLYAPDKSDKVFHINLEETVWTDDSEFVPFCIHYLDEESNLIREEGYDEYLKIVYSFEN